MCVWQPLLFLSLLVILCLKRFACNRKANSPTYPPQKKKKMKPVSTHSIGSQVRRSTNGRVRFQLLFFSWIHLTRSLPRAILTFHHPGANIFGNVISDSERRDGSFIVSRIRSAVPRDQKVTNSRHMMATKLRFSRGLKEKAPGAVTACVPGHTTPLVEIFTGPSTTTRTRSNDGEGDDFFFTFKVLSSV